MRCKYCNARLAAHDLWCVDCGRQTELVRNDLSAWKSIRESYHNFRPQASSAVPGIAFSVIAGLIPIALLIFLFNSIISIGNGSVIGTLLNLIVKAVSLSIFIPFVLIAFEPTSNHDKYSLSLAEMFSALRSYPKYLWFSLINAFYFVLIYIICFGLPNFSSHPILRLVWIVLVNYWVAICLPAVALISELKVSPWKAIKLSYRHFHDVRWNIYLLALILAVANLFSAVLFFLLLVPSVLSLAFSVFALRDYVRRLISFELLDYRR